MNDSVENRISDYVKNNLSPKEDERQLISERYDQLDGLLKGQTFQSGSYARFTAKTPVSDLDVIWELPGSYLDGRITAATRKRIDPIELEVANTLSDLADRLHEEYRKLGVTVRLKPQSHSVGIYFGKTDDEFSIDLIPAVITNEQNQFGDPFYLVPDIVNLPKSKRLVKYQELADIGWIKSDPRGYKEAAKRLNDQTKTFRKVTKIVKAWKDACKKRDDNFPLKSFHMEMVVYDIVSGNQSLECVEVLSEVFALLPDRIQSPHYPDRANAETFIDEYVEEIDEVTLRAVLGEVSQGTTISNQLLDEADPDRVEQLVKRLVGEGPSPTRSVPRTVAAVSRPYYAST